VEGERQKEATDGQVLICCFSRASQKANRRNPKPQKARNFVEGMPTFSLQVLNDVTAKFPVISLRTNFLFISFDLTQSRSPTTKSKLQRVVGPSGLLPFQALVKVFAGR